jgi:phosphoglycolate phosphatase-like HAD superfamily hydrolase
MLELERISNATTIFFDFDGVIKDSVEVKSEAFEKLFSPFGDKVSRKVRRHHEMNGGMSRFEKIPIYLEWVELSCNPVVVEQFSNEFSKLVMQKVIDSEWVLGVRSFIENNYKSKIFFVITATPQSEIEEIMDRIGIIKFFKKIIGSPTNKSDAVGLIIDKFDIDINTSIMIGDSITDHQAATDNNISFILRKTPLNYHLQNKLNCDKIDNFKL